MSKGRQLDWDKESFAEWLRRARGGHWPRMSQRVAAERIGVPQTTIARWENPDSGFGVNPPTFIECGRLAKLFGEPILEVARLAGQWDDEVERQVLVGLATTGSASRYAGVAQRRLTVVRPTDNRPGSKGYERPMFDPPLELAV